MNKLLFAFLFLPFIVFGQVTPGKYKLNLSDGRFFMEVFNTNAIRVADNCTITRSDCNTQAWEIIAVAGKANTFHIVLVNGTKYLTWNNEPNVSSRVLLTSRYPIEKIKFQSFIISLNDKGSYDIQPAIDGPSLNNYYLGAKIVSSGNNVVGIINKQNVDWTRGGYKIDWQFSSAVEYTRLPVQQPKPGVVSIPEPKAILLPVKPEQPGVVTQQPVNATQVAYQPGIAKTDPVITITTLTGGDDLRGGNDNLSVIIRLKTNPPRNIELNNINASRNWRNFTQKVTTKTIKDESFTFDDINDIVLKHSGGGGIGADNWYLDKLRIFLTIAGEKKMVVDEVGTPIHYFTGDSRSKTFEIIKKISVK